MVKGWMPEPAPRADGLEPTIADHLAAILAAWDEGALGREEVGTKILDLMTPTNIDDVVAATPAEWRDDLVARLRGIGEAEGPLFSISGGVYAYELEADPVRRAEMKADVERREAAEEAQFEAEMRPAIRAWVRRRVWTQDTGNG